MHKNKTHKIISILLFVVLLSTSILPIATFATTENESCLKSYNLETGKFSTRPYPSVGTRSRSTINKTESYIPDNVRPKARVIIGNDERTVVNDTTVFPYSTTCFIYTMFEDGAIIPGTAFMVYSNYAYTAGHCVISPEHGNPISIRVVPGKNGSQEPFGDAWVTNIECDARWIDNFNSEEDWAFLTLDSNIGNSCGWQAIACSDDYTYFETQHVLLSTSGYPKPETKNYKQYVVGGQVVKATGMNLYYTMDTEEGQSGSPVRQGDCVIGIHIGGAMINGRPYNMCSNITRARFEGFMSIINR